METMMYEQISHKGIGRSDKILAGAFLVVLVLFMMLGIFFIGMGAPIGAIVIGSFFYFFYYKKIELDFRYSLRGKNLEFTRIARHGDENVHDIDLEAVEILAPQHDPHVAGLKPDRMLIYSTLIQGQVYALIFEEDNRKCCILFDPDARMRSNLRQILGERMI